MRRKNREVNIFSMSALDLFASAMGAFMLIALIALPYYLKTDHSLIQQLREIREQLEQTQERNRQLDQQLAECRQQNQSLADRLAGVEQSLEQCREALDQTFLAIIMRWTTRGHDVDLHVIDPQGNHFYYSEHNRPGSSGQRSHFPSTQAQLTEDMTAGPGVEVWEIPVAAPGDYKVYFDFFSREADSARAARVLASVYFRDGSHGIAAREISTLREKQLVATIRVDASGQVTIR